MNNTIKREKLSSYNAILAILVVILHTENLGFYPSLSDGSAISVLTKGLEWLLSKNIASIAVPSFFMISGVLFYRDFTLDKYPKKLKSRLFSLIIPYFLWNIFRFVLFFSLGKLGVTEKLFGAPRILCTRENVIDAIFFYKYNLGFWFMYQLVLFTILAPVIRALSKNKWVGLFVILALFGLTYTDILGPILINNLNKRFILLDCFTYYFIGAYVGTHFFDFVNKENGYTKIFSIIGVILGQALNLLHIKTGLIIFNLFYLIISSISFWYLYDLLKVKPITKKLTTITFFIYALHGTILEFLQAIASAIFPETPAVALITYIAFPVIVLIILAGISIVLKKYVPKFFSIINGAR